MYLYDKWYFWFSELVMEKLNPFLPITAKHLSYLTQVIEIWILEYPVHAIFNLTLNIIQSC